MALSSALLLYILILLFTFYPFPSSADNVSGDKSVGGLHFFEVHSTNGGTGLGIKLLIVLALLGLAVYCYKKWRSFKNRLATSAIQTGFNAFTAPPNTSAPMPMLQFQQAQPAPFSSCACSIQRPQHRRHRDCRHEDEDADCARLP